MSDALRFGSLFTGIGGLDLGLERAGMVCAWQVEKDDYAQKVLQKHWPAVPRFSDVKDVGSKQLEPVDLIAGGFPCQDISVAGRGAGLAGERSGLWREFRRIVEEIRPSWVLIENVPALRTRGLSTVLSDLHALGFNAEWDCLPACAFGAPHRRDRLFIVAQLAAEFGPQWLATDSYGEGELQQIRRIAAFGGRPVHCDWWRAEPDVGRVVYGVPARVDRLRGLGNAVVPQVAEHLGRSILNWLKSVAATRNRPRNQRTRNEHS